MASRPTTIAPQGGEKILITTSPTLLSRISHALFFSIYYLSATMKRESRDDEQGVRPSPRHRMLEVFRSNPDVIRAASCATESLAFQSGATGTQKVRQRAETLWDGFGEITEFKQVNASTPCRSSTPDCPLVPPTACTSAGV